MSNIIPNLAREYFRGMPFNMMFDMYSLHYIFFSSKIRCWAGLVCIVAVITLSPTLSIWFPGNLSLRDIQEYLKVKWFWSLFRFPDCWNKGIILVLKLLFWSIFFFYIIDLHPRSFLGPLSPPVLLHQ